VFWLRHPLVRQPLGLQVRVALLDKYAKFVGYKNFSNLLSLSIQDAMVNVCNSSLLRLKINCDLLHKSIKVESQQGDNLHYDLFQEL
jgi:hypothetical protein